MGKKNQVFTAVYVFLKRENSILLMRRFNTGYKDGHYTVPAGHIDEGELPKKTVIREVSEEIGVKISEDTVTFAHVMYRIADDDKTYIDYFFTVDDWTGEPQIKEPHKCDDLQWVDRDSLPENTLNGVVLAMRNIRNKELFSEIVE